MTRSSIRAFGDVLDIGGFHLAAEMLFERETS